MGPWHKALNAERSKLQSGRDAEGFEHEQVSQVDSEKRSQLGAMKAKV